ncbi:unnamed protein product [Microthlaspi erraticum]|uniref:Uncharacterized protein n=1 Tax=Microthlaspi erraticum TaxID=1685480 RepID=A0A6D2KZU2_9BRAS|nr:unnamed protein product [Microthlaspi erraticum]
MDLESESSALEASVEVNGLIGNVETIDDDKVVSASATVEAEIDEKTTTDLDKPFNSPVEPISKGFGLRKWRRRRIRRDIVKDDTSVNIKVRKRVLSGAADPDAKQMHFSGPDVEQDSLGSVGSVNNMVGFAESSHGPGLAFAAGVDSDNSEDRSSSMSSTAASGPKVRCDKKMGHSWDKERAKHLGGKSVISWGEQRKIRVENGDKGR